ncbi:hypothetical protein SLEP1_g9803 [Rubroshorea leprosula]|uniref:Uncharacterized protein n=1 Tax=Rubroshorea leprosula TaxID=152421 RepID=A0AAV5IHC7_9ROSI|nr:hypothetical protein SLEP1_g9803 [Rubroshorea leprosula]
MPFFPNFNIVTPQNPNSRHDRRRALVNGSHECTRFKTYPIHI